MRSDFQDAIVLITSRDDSINRFGTGFIVRQVRGTTYLLTCAHVIRDVGGPDKVQADGNPATVIASGEKIGLDLSVLKVNDGLSSRPVISLKASGEKGLAFETSGYQDFGKDISGKVPVRKGKVLKGNLGERVDLQSGQSADRIQAWELILDEDYSLQPGYSGSPVIDQARRYALGVVSHREGGDRGTAIAIEELNKILKLIDSEELYKILLNLGYEKQVMLFRRLKRDNHVATFLIHGESRYYGQDWLRKRLINLLLLPEEKTKAKFPIISLGQKVRRNDTKALWRELGRWFALTEEQPSPEQLVEKIYQCSQKRDVLLVFCEVEKVPETVFDQILHQFWLPLVRRVQTEVAANQKNKYKIFLFVIDYEGRVENWRMSLAHQLDGNWEPSIPVCSPKLIEFSETELSNWLDNNSQFLPDSLVENMDLVVEEILENTDNGIPEDVLVEICDRCYWEWEEILKNA
ncbi:MAG: trypsin-like peptidase domain-containing protein [Nostoc sp. CreGUA01]|nr:trypsin-like peptidase domain-containing protein [Nostoc sp. CreGUA01]